MDETQAAIAALTARAKALRSERIKVGRRLIEDAARDAELERDINGCVAGVKALGGTLSYPPNPALSNSTAQTAYNNFLTSRTGIANQYASLKAVYGIPADDSVEVDSDPSDIRANMPRIADIVLERLKIAGESGSKAAPIRMYILDTYDVDIHDKTVSMTLNRLQIEGNVRREGHVWYLT